MQPPSPVSSPVFTLDICSLWAKISCPMSHFSWPHSLSANCQLENERQTGLDLCPSTPHYTLVPSTTPALLITAAFPQPAPRSTALLRLISFDQLFPPHLSQEIALLPAPSWDQRARCLTTNRIQRSSSTPSPRINHKITRLITRINTEKHEITRFNNISTPQGGRVNNAAQQPGPNHDRDFSCPCRLFHLQHPISSKIP
jgi:hypothetical protein